MLSLLGYFLLDVAGYLPYPATTHIAQIAHIAHIAHIAYGTRVLQSMY